MKKTIWDKRIPTLLGILLILVGVGVTTFLVKQGALFGINASSSNQPKDVRITNITDNSFTVSYTTDGSVTGSLNYGKDTNLGQTALDERDQQNVTIHKIHSITVRNITAQTNYFFSIISGGQTYLNNNQVFQVITAPAIQNQPPGQNPMSGKIILPDSSNPSEAIIYLTSDNSQVISTLVKSDGSYILPLNSLRSSDLSSYFQFSNAQDIKMLVSGDGLASNVLLSSTQISPVPVITLSKDYDFRQTQSPVATSSANLQSFPEFNNISTSSSETPQILTPKQNQNFTDQQPLFQGTGIPNAKVEVIIHSEQQQQASITTDASGKWSYRPTTPLSPGTHTITIVTKDASGILKTISQSFVVFAAGTQVSQSATPSSTLTPTSTPTPTPTTAINNITPTPTPTIIFSQTVTLTPTPTVITNSSFTITPTEKQLPPAGDPSIMTAGIVGVVISLIGGLLFLLVRGGVAAL